MTTKIQLINCDVTEHLPSEMLFNLHVENNEFK